MEEGGKKEVYNASMTGKPHGTMPCCPNCNDTGVAALSVSYYAAEIPGLRPGLQHRHNPNLAPDAGTAVARLFRGGDFPASCCKSDASPTA